MIVPHETVLRIAQDVALDVPTVVLEGDLSRTPLTAGVDNVAGRATGDPPPPRPRPRVRGAPGGTARVDRGDGPDRGLAGRAPGGGSRRPAAALGRRLVRLQRLPRGHRAGPREGRHRGLRRERPDGARAVRGAARAGPPGARGRQHRRVRRPAGGGVLRPAADHRAAGLLRSSAGAPWCSSSGCSRARTSASVDLVPTTLVVRASTAPPPRVALIRARRSRKRCVHGLTHADVSANNTYPKM